MAGGGDEHSRLRRLTEGTDHARPLIDAGSMQHRSRKTLPPRRIPSQRVNGILEEGDDVRYSTVTDLARLRGLSTS
jgi:hypothetical protein